MEIIGRLLDVSSLIATVVVALAVYRGTKTLARIQLQHEQRIAWMELDFHVLENDESLKVVDELLHPDDANATIARRRKRWICYLLRNPLESTYLGVRAGLANCEKTSMASLRASLAPLVHDELFMEMIERYTPDPAFVTLCHRLRDEQRAQAGVATKA
ncbi:hypothetical protein ABZX12_11850 [Kribbella sp. NPDC003505]|uniref:hypothetical protein n=1 Tax=Kribbella sp. NPDC003505 TaxID=3154448 RepID=UPI0033B2A8AB